METMENKESTPVLDKVLFEINFFKLLYVLSFSNLILAIISNWAIYREPGQLDSLELMFLNFTISYLVISIGILFFIKSKTSLTFKESGLGTKILSIPLLIIAIISLLGIFYHLLMAYINWADGNNKLNKEFFEFIRFFGSLLVLVAAFIISVKLLKKVRGEQPILK